MALIYLKALINGKYVMAWNGGGGDLIASASLAQEWETFACLDFNGPYLRSGSEEYVALRTNTGHYVCAEGGGGRELVANRSEPLGWETFRLFAHNVPAGNIIETGAIVSLQAYNGMWVCAENGGTERLNATRPGPGPWEQFYLEWGGNKSRPAYWTWSGFSPIA